MSKSYRIRTQPGVDKSIKVLIDQEFDYLEILSLKILQSDIYTRQCADYGVIVGRVSVNNGFGIPNAKVSVFIPIDSKDQSDPIISELYPYKSLSDVNDDGYRYNLLPYVKSYSAHIPTGTFFTRTDVLTDQTLSNLYNKYYKYNAITNDSGDYMIFGVPVGTHTVVLDVDLSDIGEFSLSPQDLIRMGIATESQVSGTNFKSSNNLRELPQIVTVNRTIEVEPLWGQPEICNLGITRTDFDLSGEANIDIRPTSIFMGSIISGPNSSALSTGCRPPSTSGHLCNLTAGPGEILAIRQTIRQDIYGRPILENFSLESGGKVIDENGTWLIDVPMNLDYYVTNEFGEQVLSNDPEKGIPTKGKYRFKVKWSQSPSLSETTRRAYFLVPNIRENDVANHLETSYAFSTDWYDYGYSGDSSFNQIIQDAINCEDRFYLMQYNKVYTVSQFIDGMSRGSGPERYIGIKNILDETCSGLNYRFPTNDGNFRFDILYIIFMFFSIILTPVFFALILIMHILYFVVWILRTIFLPVLAGYYVLLSAQAIGAAFGFGFGAVTIPGQFVIAVTYLLIAAFIALVVIMLFKINLTGIKVPILTYPDCELCKCSPDSNTSENIGEGTGAPSTNTQGNKRIPCETIKSNTEITSVSLIPGILQLFTQGVFQIPTVSPTNPNGFSSQRAQIYIRNLTGLVYDEQYASNNIGAPTFVYDDDPGYQDGNTSPDRWIYTTSLPMADRINLFNVKAKYFNGTSTTPVSNNSNPGGGVNIIEVNFQPTQTAIYHYDNTMVIICDKDSLQKLSAGQLISFQNPTISRDINTTGGITNVYGNNAVTGVTSTGATNITIQYANPDGVSGNITKTYPSVNITADTTNNYHKFPTDVEYFQVITGMTYSQFSGQCNSDIFDSLNDRYISNNMVMGQSSYEGAYKRSKNINFTPIELIEDYKNICVLILNRGVDPYTPKVPISYGLGRLFGKVNFNDVKVYGNYHMNIPIQGKFKNVSHLNSDLTNSNLGTDVYSGQKLYFNSFSYKPQISTTYGPVSAYTLGQLVVNPNGVISSGYSSFTSNLVSYYSNMDNRSLNLQPQCGGDVNNVIPMDTRVVNIDTSYGLKVSNQNKFSMMVYPKEFQFSFYPPDYVNFITPSNPYSAKTGNNQGYFPNEIIEGGPVMYTNIINGDEANYNRDDEMTGPYYKVTSSPYSITSNYYSSIYNTTGNTLTFSSGSNGNQIIMRGDRLPTSTNVDEYCCNGLVLQKNSKFEMYAIPEDGVLNVSSSESSTGSASSGDLQYTIQDLSGSTGITKVFDSFTCNGSVNLECYSCKSDGPNGTISVLQNGCQRYLGETIFEYGCYKFITTIFLSLANDWKLMFEWIARNMVMLGACRNVFSHRFVNNWVNGVLYAFPIKNEIVEYTSPLSDRPNQPIVAYCEKAIMFHSRTNNLYYRAAKYDVVSNEFKVVDGNIGFPTTIMDLGPRTDYLQELVMSDEYDGYVVNKLESSSFGTVDDILNLFIVSRFIDSTFLKTLLGSVNIIGYFSNGRTGTNFQIDADYAQLISINSELGVSPFLPSNYPDSLPGQQNPIFFDCNNVLGIFFSSDTQIRDYITPKRTIINPTGTTLGRCTFNNFPVYSQKVPLSQWKINGEYIFGKQFDDWEYGVSGNNIFSHKYQSLDRLDAGSRYFRSKNQSQTNYQKGYIYAVDNGSINPPSPPHITADSTYWDKNTISPQLVTVGAPFHFYFGLRRGASSFDRFRTKWINTNNVVN